MVAAGGSPLQNRAGTVERAKTKPVVLASPSSGLETTSKSTAAKSWRPPKEAKKIENRRRLKTEEHRRRSCCKAVKSGALELSNSYVGGVQEVPGGEWSE